MATAMLPEEITGRAHATMLETANAACKTADAAWGVADAVQWADGYSIPASKVAADEFYFAMHGSDLERCVESRKAELAPHRLSRERIESCISADNPERERLIQLAEKGMPIMVNPAFEPNGDGEWLSLRKGYREVASAVNKCYMDDFHDQGLSFVFNKNTVERSIRGVQISPAHWTEANKVQGCPIIDSSDGGPSGTPLNSKFTKDSSDELWGGIEHPTIQIIVDMGLDY
jgi:hypothetical protein